MSVSNGKITAPVSIDDLMQVTGSTSGDLDTIITSGNFNIFARCKCVPWTTVDTPRGNKTWYRGSDGKCGISIGSFYSNAQTFFENLAKGLLKWGYTPPANNRRLTDFEGYDHYAPSPFGRIWGGRYYPGSDGILTIPVEAPMEYEESPSVSLEDISDGLGGNFREWYYGVCVYYTYTLYGETKISIISYATAETPGVPAQVDIQVNNYATYPTPIYAVPFISNRAVKYGGTTPADLKLLWGGQDPVEIDLKRYYPVKVEVIEATYQEGSDDVWFRLRITNNMTRWISSTSEKYGDRLGFDLRTSSGEALYNNSFLSTPNVMGLAPGATVYYPSDGSLARIPGDKDDPYIMMNARVGISGDYESGWEPIDIGMLDRNTATISFYANRVKSDKTKADWYAFLSNETQNDITVNDLTLYRKDNASGTVTTLRNLGTYDIKPGMSEYVSGTSTGMPKASTSLGVSYDGAYKTWWSSIGEGDTDPGPVNPDPVVSASLTLTAGRNSSDKSKADWSLKLTNTGNVSVTVGSIRMLKNGSDTGAELTQAATLATGGSVTRTGTISVGTDEVTLQVTSDKGNSNSVTLAASSVVVPPSPVPDMTVTFAASRKDTDSKEANYTITFKNTGTASGTVQGVTVQKRVGTTTSTATTAVTVGNVTVPAGQTVTKTGTVAVDFARTWLGLNYTGLTSPVWVDLGEIAFRIALDCTRHTFESTKAEYSLYIENTGSKDVYLSDLRLLKKVGTTQSTLVSLGNVTVRLNDPYLKSDTVDVDKAQTWLGVSYSGISSVDWQDLGVGVDRKRYEVFIYAKWTDTTYTRISCTIEVKNNTGTNLNLSSSDIYKATNNKGTDSTWAYSLPAGQSVPGSATKTLGPYTINATSDIMFVGFNWSGNPEAIVWCPIEMPVQTEI